MEFIEMSEMLLGELTVNQYIGLICTIIGVLGGLFIIAYTIYHLVNLILDYVIYCFRKDKYKSLNFAAMRAYRQIAVLRKQVKNAPSERVYYMFYNRLIGAVQFAREMGYIGERNVLKLIDIPFNYGYKEIEADERVSQTYPQEERSEVNPNK